MAKYGNILTLYDHQPAQLDEVKAILNDNNAEFEFYGATFFVETNTLSNTRKVAEDLANTTLVYTFFHNRISDGSTLKSSIADPELLKRIDKILFQ